MDIIRQIELYYANMTKSERAAADAIMADMQIVAEQPIKEAAQAYGVSATTLVRLAKRLGLSGYSELAFQTKNYLTEHRITPSKKAQQAPEMASLIQSFIGAFEQMITPEVENAVAQLATALHGKHRILAVGLGHSGLAAEHLKYLMLSRGLFISTVTDGILIERLPPLMQSDDLIIIFSSSAAVDTYANIFKRASKKDITFALVTMNPNAPVLQKADIRLVLPMVHSLDTDAKGIRYIDSRPVFDVLVSCLTRYYSDVYPNA